MSQKTCLHIFDFVVSCKKEGSTMSGIIAITLGMLIILLRKELAKIYYYFESKAPVKSRRMYNVEYIPIFAGIIFIIRGVVSFVKF